MGIELIVTGLSAVVGAIGTIASTSALSAAADDNRKANAVQGAMQKTDSIESRRQRIREQRIRRAEIIAMSENSGTTGSSGQVGAIGALSTNLAGLIGSSLGQSKGNAAINKFSQSAADNTATANTINAWTNTIQKGISGFGSIFDQPD